MRGLWWVLVSLLLGCDVPMVTADRPLVEPGDERVMPELAGVWKVTDGSMRFKVEATEQAMSLRISAAGEDFGDASPLELTRIGRKLYAQLPTEDPGGDRPQSWLPLRLTLVDADDATVEQLCSAWFKNTTPEHAGIRFTVLDRQDDKRDVCMSGSVLLQASTPELRRWLRKHRNTDGLYDLVTKLRRELSRG